MIESMSLPMRKRTGAARCLEESVQFDEVQLLVLGIVLWNSVVPAESRSYLHELNRRQLVNQTPARLLAIRHRAVRIEKLVRDLQIVAARDEPIGLEQRGDLLALPIGDALVIRYLCLRQP